MKKNQYLHFNYIKFNVKISIEDFKLKIFLFLINRLKCCVWFTLHANYALEVLFFSKFSKDKKLKMSLLY